MSTFRDIQNELILYYSLKKKDLLDKNQFSYPAITVGSLHSNSFKVNETKIVLTIFPSTIYTQSNFDGEYEEESNDLLMISFLWIPKFSTVKWKTFMEFHIHFKHDLSAVHKISSRSGYLPRNPTNYEIMNYLCFHFKFSGVKRLLGELKRINVSLI